MDEDALLKDFFAEVSGVERDNEVERVLSSFKLNPFEHLNLPFDSTPEEVKKQYRKISLMIHPDKCHHPRAKEAFAAIAKAQTTLLDPDERGYLQQQINQAKEAIIKAKKKEIKRDHTAQLLSLVNKDALTEFLKTDEFQAEWKKKTRELLTEHEWRRRKMSLRISEEEGRLHKEEEETRDMYKRKREENEKWENTRENRVSSWRDFQKGGKKPKSGGPIKPPKLKTEDATKSYIQRPVIKR